MSKLQKTKVSYDIGDMWPIVLTFLVVGIGSAYALSVMEDVDADLTEGTTADNATESAVLGIAKFPTKLATIAGIAVAAIIIGVVVRAFSMNRG